MPKQLPRLRKQSDRLKGTLGSLKSLKTWQSIIRVPTKEFQLTVHSRINSSPASLIHLPVFLEERVYPHLDGGKVLAGRLNTLSYRVCDNPSHNSTNPYPDERVSIRQETFFDWPNPGQRDKPQNYREILHTRENFFAGLILTKPWFLLIREFEQM